MSGHGHVTPNANGMLARCGGPGLCSVCSAELAAKQARPAQPVSIYRERAHLVAYLAAVYSSQSFIGFDPAEPDWPVVYIDTQEGQLSWHISKDDMDLFAHVPHAAAVAWDGHTTAEKYERLDRLTAGWGSR